MAYNTNVYDPDDLVEGAAMVYIVSASMTNVPDEVMEELIEDPEKLKTMMKVYSNVLIKAMIEMGFDHDDVRDRAEQMIEGTEGSIEESDKEFDEELHAQAKAILGDDINIMFDDDTEH